MTSRGFVMALMLATWVFSGGCSKLKALVPRQEAKRGPVDVLLLIDDSGSFGHRQELVNTVCVPVVDELQGGDRLIVRAITDKSLPTEDLVNVVLPDSDRPFDAKTARRCRELREEAKAALVAFAAREGKAQGTDLVGAIDSIASVRPREGVRRALVIGTDLHDCGEGPEGLAGLRLDGIKVRVIFCEQDTSGGDYRERTEAWRDAFLSAGAADAQVLTPTASRALRASDFLAEE